MARVSDASKLPEGLDKIRTEAVDLRKKQCSDLLANRKRKLGDFFYLTRFPVRPIYPYEISAAESDLAKFLDRNDLEAGRVFMESSLPDPADDYLGTERPPKKRSVERTQAPPTPQKDAPPTPSDKPKLSLTEQPLGPSLPKLSVGLEDTSLISSPHPGNAPRRQHRVTPPPGSGPQDMNIRTLEFVAEDTDESSPAKPQSEVMVFVVPDRLPEPPQSTRPLAELYYTTQTLPLSKLLPSAHKTLSTDAYQLALLEGKLAVVHARIEELKRAEKWSLRQHVKFKGPLRPKVHWDHMLDEMRWMQVAYTEERKLKIAVCFEISCAVREYWRIDEAFGRQAAKDNLCVSYAPVKFLPENMEAAEVSESTGEDQAEDMTEDLVVPASDPIDASEIEIQVHAENTTSENPESESDVKFEKTDSTSLVAPVDIDTLTAAASEVPSSELAVDSPSTELQTIDPSVISHKDPTSWLNSLVPIRRTEVPSATEDDEADRKAVTTPFKVYMSFDNLNSTSKEVFNLLPRLNAFNMSAPYINEFDGLSLTSVTRFLSAPDLGRGWQRLVLDEAPDDSPLSQDVSKSSTDNKRRPLFSHDSHRRYHVIKAPQPPNLKYLEYRTPTLWLPQDDSRLLKLAKEFQYNWSIVSMHMQMFITHGYVSNIERRTPWQCFERWHQLTPSFSLTELKGQYAQQAQVWMDAALKAQAVTKRRISPLGVGPESIQRGHRRLRWASMFDAIRKGMRKRENAPKPNSSVQRKAQMSEASKTNCPSPMDLSKLKHERDKSIAEAYIQQQRNSQMALAAAQGRLAPGVTQNPAGAAAATSAGQPVVGAGAPTAAGATRAVQSAGDAMNRVGMTGVMGGVAGAGNAAVIAGGVQHRPVHVGRPGMDANATGGNQVPRVSSEQIQHMYQMERQRQLLRQEAVAAANGGSPGLSHVQQPQGQRSSPGPSTSPGPAGLVAPMLSQQQINNVINQLSQQYPELSPDQVTKLADAQIRRYLSQQKQLQQQNLVGQQRPMGQPQTGVSRQIPGAQMAGRGMSSSPAPRVPVPSPQQVQATMYARQISASNARSSPPTQQQQQMINQALLAQQQKQAQAGANGNIHQVNQPPRRPQGN